MNDNQHYTTRAYLEKFISPSSPEKILHIYERNKGRNGKKGTRHLACADKFFVQVENGNLNNRIDQARSDFEKLAFSSARHKPSSIVKCLFNDDYYPNKTERIELETTAIFLRLSSPVQIQNAAMIMLMEMQRNLLNTLNTDETKKRFDEAYGSEAAQKLQEAREHIWHGRLVKDVGEENWKQLGFNSFRTFEIWMEPLQKMNLTVCLASPESFFLTSDNPIILTSQSGANRPGLCSPDSEVWFPISWKKGLLWSWKNQPTGQTTLGHSATRSKNRNIIKHCYKDIFSPRPDDWIHLATKDNEFEPCYGHFGSLAEMEQNHSFNGKDSNDRKIKIFDMMGALKTGKLKDVIGLRRL